MRHIIPVAIAALFLSACPESAQEFNNQSVITLARAGIGAKVLLAKIAGLPCAYDVSTDGILALKGAGVADSVIAAMVVEVYRDKAPVSARNFLRYVDARRLDGMIFYRTVKVAEHFGFVQFGVQNAPARMFPPIRHEPTSETGLKHLDGTLSMPRLKPGSARGEFTIMVGDQPAFDADPARPGDNLGYAAFARVVAGEDVLMTIFNAPTAPGKTILGSFKGEVPEAPVKILSARRIAG